MKKTKIHFFDAATWILMVFIAPLISNCGALISTADLSQAKRAIESAEEVDADVWAVYEFVSASEYLLKAREEWAHSDFQHAHEYAERAIEFAEDARERATSNPNQDFPDEEQ